MPERSQAYINRLKADVKKRQEKEAFVKRMKAAKKKAKVKRTIKAAGVKVAGVTKAGAKALMKAGAKWYKQQSKPRKGRKRKPVNWDDHPMMRGW